MDFASVGELQIFVIGMAVHAKAYYRARTRAGRVGYSAARGAQGWRIAVVSEAKTKVAVHRLYLAVTKRDKEIEKLKAEIKKLRAAFEKKP